MAGKAQRACRVVAGALAGAAGTAAAGMVVAGPTGEMWTAAGVGASAFGALTWIAGRLIRELFWLRAIDRPLAAAEKILGPRCTRQDSLAALRAVLAAQTKIVRARASAERRDNDRT